MERNRTTEGLWEERNGTKEERDGTKDGLWDGRDGTHCSSRH